MKKILKVLGLVILAIILLILIVPIFVSKNYTVEESIVINAPKNMVYEYISNLNNFNEWSPWSEVDPNMEITISGDGKSVGSQYQWEGNKDAGKGGMKIIEKDRDRVDIELTFIEPWESESFTQYRFEETENGTKVIWYMEGRMPYPMNIFNLFSMMKNAIGTEYQKGLNAVKEILEERNSLGIGKYKIQETHLSETTFWGIKSKVSFREMEDFFTNSYAQLYESLEKHEVNQIAIPSALYYIWDEENMETEVAATLAFDGNGPEKTPEGLSSWKLSGPALKVAYSGDYENLADVHGALHKALEERGVFPKSPAIEKYLIGPATETNPDNYLTHIYYLIED
jgi:effector-binding domain-containing protein